MKARWKILTGIAIGGVGVAALAAWVQADFLEWDLNLHLPTASVKDSRLYAVFASRVSVSPREFDLAGGRYCIKEAWLEYRAEPRRVSAFFTRQEILPELVLCVDLGWDGATAGIQIKDAKRGHILVSGANGVRFSEVGVAFPKSFILCTRDGRAEAEFQIEARSNQSLEPTPAAGTSAAEQPLVPAAIVAHL